MECWEIIFTIIGIFIGFLGLILAWISIPNPPKIKFKEPFISMIIETELVNYKSSPIKVPTGTYTLGTPGGQPIYYRVAVKNFKRWGQRSSFAEDCVPTLNHQKICWVPDLSSVNINVGDTQRIDLLCYIEEKLPEKTLHENNTLPPIAGILINPTEKGYNFPNCKPFWAEYIDQIPKKIGEFELLITMKNGDPLLKKFIIQIDNKPQNSKITNIYCINFVEIEKK